KDNPDLTAALETATAASDEAAAPVYAAEDLYIALTDEDRAQEAVQTAYSALDALFVTMQLTMENPTAPEEGGGTPPDQDEIATVLYGELPDAPTGSYMGSYGLPIATGDIARLQRDCKVSRKRERPNAEPKSRPASGK